MTSPVFHIRADTEATWLQTTSVEPLRLENLGRSKVFLFGLFGDTERVSEERTFSENTAYFSCKLVGLHRVFFLRGQLPQSFESCLEAAKASGTRHLKLSGMVYTTTVGAAVNRITNRPRFEGIIHQSTLQRQNSASVFEKQSRWLPNYCPRSE